MALPRAEPPALGLRLGLNAAAASVRALGRHRYRLSDPLANALFALRPSRRRATIRNFQAVFPGLGPAGARRLAARSYREYGRTALDFLYVHHLPRGRVFAEVSTTGVESVIAHLQQGRSGILVVIHQGSWDVPAALAAAYGVDLLAVMDDEGSERMSELVLWARAEIGVRAIRASRAPAVLLRHLHAGRWVALVCDIPGETPSVEVEFMGHRARFSPAPAVLAARTGAPLFPTTCIRRPQGGYLLEIHPAVAIERDADPAEALGRIIPVFEAAVRRWPQQWYPFRADRLLDVDQR